jgi:hypothetical protein
MTLSKGGVCQTIRSAAPEWMQPRSSQSAAGENGVARVVFRIRPPAAANGFSLRLGAWRQPGKTPRAAPFSGSRPPAASYGSLGAASAPLP